MSPWSRPEDREVLGRVLGRAVRRWQRIATAWALLAIANLAIAVVAVFAAAWWVVTIEVVLGFWAYTQWGRAFDRADELRRGMYGREGRR